MELFIIFLLILFNGLLSMSEAAIISSRKYKLENNVKKGNLNAKTALKLANHPTRFLSTIQIGITLIGILLGIFSNNPISSKIEYFFYSHTLTQSHSHIFAIIIIGIITTYISIVFGELAPKRLALAFPETISMLVAKPIQFISFIMIPFVWIISKSNDLIFIILNINTTNEDKVTEEEIISIIQESADDGEIQEIEQDIVERVFDLGDRTVSAIMTHYTNLVWIDIKDDIQIIKAKIKSEIHSVYPVGENTIDSVTGIILLKELFLEIESPDFNLQNYIRKPHFVHEDTPAYKLLDQFKDHKVHSAIVVDEFGAISGMITIGDLMDELVGDMSKIDEQKFSIQQRTENTWLADAQFPFYDFLRFFDIENYEEDEDNSFNTIGGLLISMSNSYPKTGDKITFFNFEIEIIDMDNRRIDKLLITKITD